MPISPIPRPYGLSMTHGSSRLADGDTIFTADVELREIVGVFIADVIADGGPVLAETRVLSTAQVVLELVTSAELSAPAAEGLRADAASLATPADERYGLEVDAHGVRLKASTREGIHRGLTTLRQLVASADGVVPFLRIQDGPRFSWRGLALDVVRTFHDPSTIRRVIDMCSLYKINVLHLHLTDNEGWRLEVPGRPALTEIGGAGARDGRPGGHLSAAEMAGLVAYATARFVTIVPEIDMPGHSAAALRAYPELATLHEGTSSRSSGVIPDTLDHRNEGTWALVDDVLDAVVTQFPHSAYIHIGADEVFGLPDDAYSWFVERAMTAVRARGRRVIGWQEMAAGPLTRHDAIQYWIDATPEEVAPMLNRLPAHRRDLLSVALEKSRTDIPNALAAGARILVSPATRAYFDAPHTGSPLDPAQEKTRTRVGHSLYPPVSLRAGVDWDPVADTRDIQDATQIAGVEAAIWSETITDRDDLEFMLLPRLCGIAEKAWSVHTSDWEEYASRLAPQARAWTRRGWNWYRTDEIDWIL